MGTLAQKLAYLGETKAALRQAINDAGGSISADTPFRQYADWIRDQGATLWLDFVNQNYYSKDAATHYPAGVGFDLITFTRSTGGGRFNAQGQYEWLPANQPRIDYDPVTGECLGLLIEEQRTNLLTYSSDFANAVWQPLNSQIIENASIAPDGTLSATKITATGSNQSSGIYRPIGGVVGGPRTWSIYAKRGEHRYLLLRPGTGASPQNFIQYDLQDGEVVFANGANTYGMELQADGWYRCWFTVNDTSLSNRFAAYTSDVRLSTVVNDAGDGTSGIYIWGAQLEAGSFPTSPIHTTDAQVTRAADIASVNELSPWLNPVAGTLFVEWVHNSELVPAGTAQYVVGLFDGNAVTNFVNIQWNASEIIQGLSSVGGVDQGPIDAKLAADTRSHRAAMSVSAAGRYISVDGSSALTGPQTSMPVFDRMFIGNRWDAVRAINGHIRSLRYFPRALTNAELQAMTA